VVNCQPELWMFIALPIYVSFPLVEPRSQDCQTSTRVIPRRGIVRKDE
jgi:hypothetical protein